MDLAQRTISPRLPVKKPESGVIPDSGLLIALLADLPLEHALKPHKAPRRAI